MTNDKFIMIDLNDEKAGHIAEVLKNKTAKKILDYLGDVKEASEKDIADGLGMAINTIEYNLKKLIKAGFIKKSKNFFWSVKGRKIEVYKLAKRHVVISPGRKPRLDVLKTILPLVFIVAILVAFVGFFMYPEDGEDSLGIDDIKLKQFKSQAELEKFLADNSDQGNFYGDTFRNVGGVDFAMAAEDSVASVTESGSGGTSDFSKTNIQVEGVDEADIVKNDGEFIYVVSGNRVLIVDAHPAEDMKILSEINFTSGWVGEIYINKDKLVVFGNDYYSYVADEEVDASNDIEIGVVDSLCAPGGCGGGGSSKSVVYTYDISDKENPILEDRIENNGNYVNSRMIGDYVYVIYNKYIYLNNPVMPVYWEDGVQREVMAKDISYMPYPDTNYVFTSIMAVNLNDGDVNNKVYLTGGSGTIYVSEDNIYLTYMKRISQDSYFNNFVEDVVLEALPDSKIKAVLEIMDSDDPYYMKSNAVTQIVYDHSMKLKGEDKDEFDGILEGLTESFQVKISKESEKTMIHKIEIDKGDIDYAGVGEVPGYVLNQFSMDEHDGYFRIATTTGSWRDVSLNHVFVLDKDLDIVGSIEDLAKGERIYSARFIGDRVYMVTFRRVDPLYVIDLGNPKDPAVLGYLKVTGYSSYLHPYDENHIIGVGMEATEEGRVQGVKIALFDVTDVENPKEISKYKVGGDSLDDAFRSWSSTDVSYDHKAFLFDKEKELLVIPISYTKYNVEGWSNYEYFQGAYVFNINLEEGISLNGKIAHFEGDRTWQGYVRRSLYMDEVLYTISNYKIKANSLVDLTGISEVKIYDWENDYPSGITRGDIGFAEVEVSEVIIN